MAEAATSVVSMHLPRRREKALSTKEPLPRERFFAEELFDMGGDREGYHNIYMPLSEAGRKPEGVTSQYFDREKIERYHTRQTNHAQQAAIFNQALQYAASMQQPEAILDIGCGTGNTTLPLMDLFPEATIVASDVSPPMLRFLQKELSQREDAAERCHLVCLDAMRDYYKPNSFDIVVGRHILGHMFAPEQTLRAIFKALKPGGLAIFLEPFEGGHALKRMAYQQILDRLSNGENWDATPVKDASIADEKRSWLRRLFHKSAKAEKLELNQKTKELLSYKAIGVFEQLNIPPEEQLHRDNKCLFSRAMLEIWRQDIGFQDMMIYPAHDVETPLEDYTKALLRSELNLMPESLPKWAWQIIKSYDSAFTSPMKQDLMLDGVVLLQK